MKRILIVFGTRPEAIKMAPVVKEFQRHPDHFETVVCVTAQHREMLDQVLRIFDIVPDIDLNIMQAGQDLTDVTTRVLTGMKDVLKEVRPDVVFVHGDTTTSAATALAAFYQQIPVAHVEAGLRTHNIYSPWPEEVNRQITGRIATWHFAPTSLNRQNLIREGVPDDRIIVTGNTVIDALYMVLDKIANTPGIVEEIEKELDANSLPVPLVRKWNGNEGERRMVLITGHRRENFGEGFINICEAIRDLANDHQDVDFVYPVHMNPNVRKPVQEILEIKGSSSEKNIYLIEPVQYLPFVYLMQKCVLVLTDSGGIQEEAPGLGKPVLVMRNETERPEGVDAGTVKLTGTDKNIIIDEVHRLLTNHQYYTSMSGAINPYGDGKAGNKIIGSILLVL
ncbi:MAG TPA: UDP-N-acetylglucosamine 2-epimerase (non-hydrolyzing) [Bacteroidales bacterium]|nr:UDP-N-acetylglucosamine 2-epimerase (non-hydrolyzing) [Bacteroidales bacterium]